MTIITGSGHCGTQTVAALLGCTHEMNREHFVKGWWDLKGRHTPPWHGRGGKFAWLAEHFKDVQPSKVHDANNIYVHFLHELSNIFGAKIVFLTRHPADFVTSALARNCHKGDIFGMHPNQFDDPLAWELWPHWADHQKCAWIWLHRNATAWQALNVYQLPHWHGQIEQLYEPGVIEGLEKWTGRPADKMMRLDGVRLHQATKPKPKLTPGQYQDVAKITGQMAQIFGYEFKSLLDYKG